LTDYAVTNELLNCLFGFGSVKSLTESMQCFFRSLMCSIMDGVQYFL